MDTDMKVFYQSILPQVLTSAHKRAQVSASVYKCGVFYHGRVVDGLGHSRHAKLRDPAPQRLHTGTPPGLSLSLFTNAHRALPL